MQVEFVISSGRGRDCRCHAAAQGKGAVFLQVALGHPPIKLASVAAGGSKGDGVVEVSLEPSRAAAAAGGVGCPPPRGHAQPLSLTRSQGTPGPAPGDSPDLALLMSLVTSVGGLSAYMMRGSVPGALAGLGVAGLFAYGGVSIMVRQVHTQLQAPAVQMPALTRCASRPPCRTRHSSRSTSRMKALTRCA
jgi:hypothetical protein